MKGSLLISEAVERHFADALEHAAPGVPRVVVSPSKANLNNGNGNDGKPEDRELEDVTATYFSGDVYPDWTADFLRTVIRAKNLHWFHSFSAGVDNAFFQGLLARGVRLTTSSGAMAAPIAQTVMLYVLAFSRDLLGWQSDQRDRNWNPRDIRDLSGRRLGVIGLGPIGVEVAKLGAAFGMEVVGFRRNPRGDEPCETLPIGALGAALESIDYLVLAAPLTEDTRGLIDARALRAMNRDAVLINIARGEIVDEAALVAALEDERIRGAALDVFEVEPLPEQSPLWTMPNVIVTPHSSGSNPGNFFRATEIFVDNLGRYVRGEALRNEVLSKEER